MPRTFRLSLLRIEVRVTEVTKHMMDPQAPAAIILAIGI